MTHTVGDDTAKGGSFEVKLNIHVFSLQRETRESLGSPSCLTTCGEGSVLPRSPSTAPPSFWADAVTYKSRGVVIADGLGIAKCCRNEGRENERVAAPSKLDSRGVKPVGHSLQATNQSRGFFSVILEDLLGQRTGKGCRDWGLDRLGPRVLTLQHWV